MNKLSIVLISILSFGVFFCLSMISPVESQAYGIGYKKGFNEAIDSVEVVHDIHCTIRIK